MTSPTLPEVLATAQEAFLAQRGDTVIEVYWRGVWMRHASIWDKLEWWESWFNAGGQARIRASAAREAFDWNEHEGGIIDAIAYLNGLDSTASRNMAKAITALYAAALKAAPTDQGQGRDDG